jgi:hypothetical protein
MKQDESFARGFNAGYQLQKHDPELGERLIQSLQNTSQPYAEALKAGRDQYVHELRERLRSHHIERSNHASDRTKDKDRDRER